MLRICGEKPSILRLDKGLLIDGYIPPLHPERKRGGIHCADFYFLSSRRDKAERAKTWIKNNHREEHIGRGNEAMW